MSRVSLKQDEDNFLELTILCRSYADPDDSWDGNLLNVRVEYASNGVRDGYFARLFTTDIENFRDELAGDVEDET